MKQSINLPFIKSRGFECGQACAAMILKYFYPEINIDFDDINSEIHHETGKVTFPLQMAILLDDYNLDVACYSSDEVPTLDENPDIFKKWFGADYEILIKDVNIDSYNWMAKEGRARNIFMQKKTSFDEVINYFLEGKLVSFPIDWNTLVQQEGPYQGHFIIISGIDGENLLIHDPDSGPYLQYSKASIAKAYNHPAIEDDLIVVNGIKKSHS